MKYKDRIKCECCKHDITMTHAVIEWGYDRIGSMHVCCHKCAFGNNPSNIISDMILDQPLYDADTVYDRLNGGIVRDYGQKYEQACIRIRNIIFE